MTAARAATPCRTGTWHLCKANREPRIPMYVASPGAFDAIENCRIVRRTSLRAARCHRIAHTRLQTRLCRIAHKIERCANSRFRIRDRSPLTGKGAPADRLHDRCRDVHRDGRPRYDDHCYGAHPRVAESDPSFFSMLITTAAKLPLLNRQPDEASKAEAHLDSHGRRLVYKPLVKALRVDVFAPSV